MKEHTMDARNTLSRTAKTLSGSLTPFEIEDLRKAYAGGTRGSLLIGLKRERRLLTLLLPPQKTEAALIALAVRNAHQLRRIGADGFIQVRRARIGVPGRTTVDAMFVCERQHATRLLRIVSLRGFGADFQLPRRFSDIVSDAIAAAIGCSEANK